MTYTYAMKILLTEGAGLTSRQLATRLDATGHDVTAAVSDPLCMARFTRHVHHLMTVPDFGADPLAWFDQMLLGAVSAEIDVIFPTQEQVAVLSHQLPRLEGAGLMTAVPPFASLRRLQDKITAGMTLAEVGVPQPHTLVVQDVADTNEWTAFPAYAKAPVGTGSTGVLRVTDAGELAAAVGQFIERGARADGGVLVQEAVQGILVMAQCVFDAGRMVAFHVNERIQEGANGSASAKASLHLPALQSDLSRLGQALAWHGALSADAIVTDDGVLVIDVNPRLVEPGNAWASGTDLVGAMMAVAQGTPVPTARPSQVGVRTHQLLMAILGAAQRRGRRRDVLRELAAWAGRRGAYAGSHEELQPVWRDWRALVLPLAATISTLTRPSLCNFFTDGAVARYALAPEGWRQLIDTAPLAALTAMPA
jgi:biotin carboxylase